MRAPEAAVESTVVNQAAVMEHARIPTILRSAGWWGVLTMVLLRCLAAPEPFPYWDVDPGAVVLPVTGLTPAMSLAVDVVIMLAAGLALLGEVLAGATILLWPVMLWVLGCCGATIHGLALRSGSIDDLRIGATWCAAMSAGLGAMHLCRDPRMKRVTLAAALGIIAMLAAKGAVQVFYEHADTVAHYRQDRESYLRSQGWLPNSVAAKNFERRLNQPEATGWFGLANVFATFAACAAVGLTGCAILAWRESRINRRMPDGWAGVLSLGALAALGALVLAGSKGGFTAAALGLAMLAVFMLARRGARPRLLPGRWGGILAVGIVAAALAAIVLRGFVGERVGELSLLFRWYYMEGAIRAFVESPKSILWGTGPDGFRDAYMRLKPALSPEEVSSPHSVLFDWGATLGVFGLAWGALWISWVWRLGRGIACDGRQSPLHPVSTGNLPIHPESGRTAGTRAEGWFVVLSISAAVLIASWLERAMGSPEQAAARFAGLAGWIGISLGLLQLLRVSGASIAVLGIAVLTAAIHCQIEVTPIWSGSACWIAIVLGAAGAGAARPSVRRHEDAGLIAPVFAIGLSGVIAWLGVVPVSRWEAALSQAADHMRPMAEIKMRLSKLSTTRPEGDSMDLLARDLAELTQSPPPVSSEELQRSMARLTMKTCSGAAVALNHAEQLAPRHFTTVETLCRLLMEQAAAESALGRGAQASALEDQALEVAHAFAARRPGPAIFGLIGNIQASRFEFNHERGALAGAVIAWTRASQLDPYGTSFPLRTFRLLESSGRTEEAVPWAIRLLELNDLQRLDPLKKLSDDELAAVRRVLGTK